MLCPEVYPEAVTSGEGQILAAYYSLVNKYNWLKDT